MEVRNKDTYEKMLRDFKIFQDFIALTYSDMCKLKHENDESGKIPSNEENLEFLFAKFLYERVSEYKKYLESGVKKTTPIQEKDRALNDLVTNYPRLR